MVSQSRNTEGLRIYVHIFCFALAISAECWICYCTCNRPRVTSVRLWVFWQQRQQQACAERTEKFYICLNCNSKFVTRTAVHLIWSDYSWQGLSRVIKPDQVHWCTVQKLLEFPLKLAIESSTTQTSLLLMLLSENSKHHTSHMRAGCVYVYSMMLYQYSASRQSKLCTIRVAVLRRHYSNLILAALARPRVLS